MHILLTGASGFTGQHFMAAARAAGHRVTPLLADLRDPSALQSAVHAAAAPAAIDAVLHLGAISFVGHADPAAFYAVNTVGACHLLDALAALAEPPRCVLLASSANVYGNCVHSPIAETQTPAPTNHYAASKLAMEHLALAGAERLPIMIARPFNYTGPGQAASFVIPKLVQHYAQRAASVELGNLHVLREYNDVRMVCAAYLTLLDHGEPGEVYNVCSGQPYTLQHVMDTLAALTGHALVAEVNPAFVRANEVHRLCGAPAKLQRLCDAARVALPPPSLGVLLQWMLSEARGEASA
jgi:nucleoside-diphosphate-sugar epimerase